MFCAIVKIILRLPGCFIFWPLGKAPPQEVVLDGWRPGLLCCCFLPEPVQALRSWVTDCFLPAFEAKVLWTSWAAAVGVLGVGVLGLTGEKPFPWYSPHMSSEDFFLALFCIASWTLCFLRSSKEKYSVHSARRGSVTSSCCLDWARNCDWHQSDPFLPHQWQNGLSVPTIKP